MNPKYYYKLVRYYQMFKQNITTSLLKRQVYDEQIIQQLLAKLDNDILLVKQNKVAINNLNNMRKQQDIACEKIKLHTLKQEVKLLQEQIILQILNFPNILCDSVITEDKVEFVRTLKGIDISSNITFTEYIDKYTIKSIGRVIFMNYTLTNLFFKLQNFLIYYNSRNNFQLLNSGEIIHKSFLISAGQLPAFQDTLYQVSEHEYCAPTGEVMILEYVLRNFTQITHLLTNQAFLQYCLFSKCYRNENANSTTFNKPLIRQNVFSKVETFIVCKLEDEEHALHILFNNVKNLLEQLGLQYRIIKVGSIEMSKTAYRQYDFEVYLPVSQKYIEIASCSSCHIYQITRDDINCDKNDSMYCTLNCSALPLERLLASFIEYYWNDDIKEFQLPELDSNQQPFG